MKNTFKLILLFAAITLFATNCKKDDNNAPVASSDSTIVLDASSKTAWKYYSFEKGDTVAVSNPETSLNWDIAFNKSALIKTNGGKNGIGQAGVFNSKLNGQAGFDLIILVPDTAVFVQDDSTLTSNNRGGANLQVSNSVLNLWLNEWYIYNVANPGALSSKNYIYITKTASGKFVKLWIQSYFRDEDAKPGFFKIKYFYQKDGSKNLK